MSHLPWWNTVTLNKSVHLPDRWIFFDTETRDAVINDKTIELKLRLGSACYWRRPRGTRKFTEYWKDFTEADDFWEWVLEHTAARHTLYLCAHNVAFDLLTLQAFSSLATRGFRLSRVYHRGLTTIVRFANGQRRICALDTMNYYPASLKELGDHVELPKRAIPYKSATDTAWLSYCRADVQIVKTAIARLLQTLERKDLGSFKPTGPGLAFNIFRHKYMQHEIRAHHLPSIVKLEREAYVGSFTQPFRLLAMDGGPYYKLDVNSMYPSVMAEHKYPAMFLHHEGRMAPKELRRWLKHYCVIARVNLYTEEAWYPVRTGGETVYPVGELGSILATRGLTTALKHGHVLEVVWALVYERAPLFRKYVRSLYARKQEATARDDKAGALFWKMLLNGLYGKFGQRATETTLAGECDPLLFESEEQWDAYRHTPITVTRAGGTERITRDAGETRNSFPAIAAHVTEDARMKLFGLIARAGQEHVLYCDTDSLIVDGAGLGNLRDDIDPKRLGCLKLEATGDSLLCFGRKDYLFNHRRVLKGWRKADERTVFTEGEVEQFTGLDGALRNERREAVLVRRLIRHHDPSISGVRVTRNLEVRPLLWPEDQARATDRTYLKPMMEQAVKEGESNGRH